MAPEDTSKFQAALLEWYTAHKRDLPWRRTRDPYAVLVSEIMLQQTRVDTVIGYYHRFLERFPTVRSLASASQDDVLKTWEGLGYYARARNLHRAAKKIVSEFQNTVPDSREAIRSLPGVGEYIAAAVLSIAYGKPFAVVDGNVKRVLARITCAETPINDPTALRVFTPVAEAMSATADPGSYNQAVMELGALVCLPARPRCGDCPVSSVCEAFKQNVVSAYPKTVPRRPVPTHEISVGVVRRRGKLLITKRAEDGLLGGLFEFPGGKIKPGETPEAACARELLEETGLSVDVGERIATIRHAYTHFKIVLYAFYCTSKGGRVRLDGPIDFKWVRPEELSAYPFPKANLKFLHLLR